MLTCIAISAASMMAPLQILRMINNRAYRAPISNSLEEGYFPVFYGRLVSARIPGENPIPRIHLSSKAIAALIEESDHHGGRVSAILRQLDSGWKQPGCAIYPETCGEFAGGWFLWALRQSIGSSLSHVRDESAFQVSAKLAAKEMEEICKSSTRIACGLAASGYMPPPNRWDFSNPALELIRETFSVLNAALIPKPLREDADFVHSYNASASAVFQRQGLTPMANSSVTVARSLSWSSITSMASFVGFLLQAVMIGVPVQGAG